MATANFHNKNASKVFAIQSEMDEWGLVEEGIIETFKDKGWQEPYKEEWDGDRNFEGKALVFKEIEVGIWILKFRVFLRAGYYDGANLDWDLWLTKDSLKDYQEGELEYMEVPNYVQDKIDSSIKKIEKTFEKISTPLDVVAQFSNGETIYEKAK